MVRAWRAELSSWSWRRWRRMLSATDRLWRMAAVTAVDEENLEHQDVSDLLHIDGRHGEASEVVGAWIIYSKVAGIAFTLGTVKYLDVNVELP